MKIIIYSKTDDYHSQFENKQIRASKIVNLAAKNIKLASKK